MRFQSAGTQAFISSKEVVSLLSSLADKSLVVRDSETGRWRMTESILAYGQSKLQPTHEAESISERHWGSFVALVEEAESHLKGRDQREWLEILQVEHDNIRAAIERAVHDGEKGVETALRLCGAAWRFWNIRGFLTEGRALCELALGLPRFTEQEPLRAKALNGAGVLAYRQGDYSGARMQFEESAAIRRKLGDQQGVSACLNNLALVAYDQGAYSDARTLLEESLAIKRTLGDQSGISALLNNLGSLAYAEGDYRRARGLFESCLAIRRKLGDPGGIAETLHNLGNTTLAQDDLAAARPLYEEGLTLERERGNRGGIAILLNGLGMVAHAEGHYKAAARHRRESLQIRAELGDRWGIAESLRVLATTFGACGDNDRAARLWGASEQLRLKSGCPIEPSEQKRYEQDVAQARAAFGAKRFKDAWESGRKLRLEEAVSLALEEAMR
jgi:non-specific serine/threonine protein kinase